MKPAYYNENDPFAVAYLRNLINEGLIADGDVDERSIVDVRPVDLDGYGQCHFFAGIGVWSYALRLAGWPDDRPVWTGSCPCQGFSAAGKRLGFADERHLWPFWLHLIRQCRPAVVFGEQVASKDGLAWLDLVQSDMEGEGYAIGAADLCAAGVGAPHIRQRLWFVGVGQADSEGSGVGTGLCHCGSTGLGRDQSSDSSGIGWVADPSRYGTREHARELHRHEGEHEVGTAHGHYPSVTGRATGELADDNGDGCGDAVVVEHATGHGRIEGRPEPSRWGIACGCLDGVMGDAIGEGLEGYGGYGHGARGRALPSGSIAEAGTVGRPAPTNGIWRNADWLLCRDGKWRPVEPGTFPLAHGIAARVGRLRAYGNAIVAQSAQAFIESYCETVGLHLDVTHVGTARLMEAGHGLP